jgi:exosortase/archaeosortase family protein
LSDRRRVCSLIALQLLAFWPVWRWYFARVTESTDELWSLLALSTAVVILFLCRRATAHERTWPSSLLLLPSLILLIYAATYAFVPPLLRAGIAATAVGLTLSRLRFGRTVQTGLLGLVYLSLPLIPTLQFYGGYPLRMVVAGVAAPVIRLGGFAVIQEGTCLNWSGKLIWIDAPCSGVRMLWAGLYLACTLASLYGLRFWKTLLALACAFCAIIAGNIFRAVALFYLEAGIVEMPGWAHDYAGAVAFLLVAASIVTAVQLIRGEKPCGELLST